MKTKKEILEAIFIKKEFDNGMRRLKTILNKAAKKYDLKTHSL